MEIIFVVIIITADIREVEVPEVGMIEVEIPGVDHLPVAGTPGAGILLNEKEEFAFKSKSPHPNSWLQLAHCYAIPSKDKKLLIALKKQLLKRVN